MSSESRPRRQVRNVISNLAGIDSISNTPMRKAEKLIANSPLKLSLNINKKNNPQASGLKRSIAEVGDKAKFKRVKGFEGEKNTVGVPVSQLEAVASRPQRERKEPDRFVPGSKANSKTKKSKRKLKEQSEPSSTQPKSKPKEPKASTKKTTTSTTTSIKTSKPKTGKTKVTVPKLKKAKSKSTKEVKPKVQKPQIKKLVVPTTTMESDISSEEEEEEEDVGYDSSNGEKNSEESDDNSSDSESLPPEEVNQDVFNEVGGLTEGCFILAPESNEQDSFDFDEAMPFRPLLSNRENFRAAELRHASYLNELKIIEELSQKQLFRTQQHSFNSILKHLYTRFNSYLESSALLSVVDQTKKERFLNTVTGSQSLELLVVRHGSNRSDANPLYDHLIELLNKPESPNCDFDIRVADIQKTALNPSLDTILRCLFCEWLSPRTNTSLESRFQLDLGSKKAFPYDLSILKDWYKQFKAGRPLPNKPVEQEIFVLLLRDYQLLDSQTLQDLIRILSLYRPFLPIWVILGASASPISLESLLPQDSLSMVNIQTFDLVDPHRSLLELIEQLFIDRKHGLKLNVRTFQLLFDTFVDYTHSLNTFMASFKYSLMDHFYSNPLSILVSNDNTIPSDNLKILWSESLFSHEHCELVRMQPSFQLFIKQRLEAKKSDIQLILEDDSYLSTEIIPTMLDRIYNYQEAYPIVFKCLLEIQTYISKSNSSRFSSQSAVSLYNSNLEVNIVQSHFFDSLMRQLVTLSAHNLTGIITLLEQIGNNISIIPEPLKNSGSPLPSEWLKRIYAYCNQLDLASEISTDSSTGLINLLKEFFRVFLPSYKSFPLHEPFYYANIEILEKTFNPQPQAALEYALTRPRVYLPTPASREGGAPPLPDAAIAYRLYKEAGRLINLYDWLKAFEHLVVKQHFKQDARSKPPTPVDIQARFAQCLNELKFLGYIQPTQRKTDHVQKLTWN